MIPKIINKTVVYADTVLSLKDKGNNLKITSISNVNEASLENCLKVIFQANPNVTFNTIQYSRNNEKVYFYTDKEISTMEYENSKFFRHKPLTSKTKILEELKNVLMSEKNKDDNCISLYEVYKLIKKMYCQYENMKETYESNIEYSLGNYLIIHDFDYKNNELCINLEFIELEYDMICFSKKNNDLFITRSETYRDKNILATAGEELSELYDEFMKYKDFMEQISFNLNALNSNFIISISHYGVSISDQTFLNRKFELSFPSYNDEYNYDCNSSLIIDAFKGNEMELLKRIFVKISDCPKWSQQILYETRKNELVKKQKKLKLTRKLFHS